MHMRSSTRALNNCRRMTHDLRKSIIEHESARRMKMECPFFVNIDPGSHFLLRQKLQEVWTQIFSNFGSDCLQLRGETSLPTSGYELISLQFGRSHIRTVELVLDLNEL